MLLAGESSIREMCIRDRAKYVALHYNELSFPFRRYQIGKVYRGERAQRGRFRDFYQADIDVIGDGKLDITNEAEIPAIIYQTFTELGLKRFQTLTSGMSPKFSSVYEAGS